MINRNFTITLCSILLTGLLPAGLSAQGDSKTRVYIEQSDSWAVTGGLGGVDDVIGGGTQGGARPQTAEIIKTFGKRCPSFIITMKKDKADYVVLLQHEGGKDM